MCGFYFLLAIWVENKSEALRYLKSIYIFFVNEITIVYFYVTENMRLYVLYTYFGMRESFDSFSNYTGSALIV